MNSLEKAQELIELLINECHGPYTKVGRATLLDNLQSCLYDLRHMLDRVDKDLYDPGGQVRYVAQVRDLGGDTWTEIGRNALSANAVCCIEDYKDHVMSAGDTKDFRVIKESVNTKVLHTETFNLKAVQANQEAIEEIVQQVTCESTSSDPFADEDLD